MVFSILFRIALRCLFTTRHPLVLEYNCCLVELSWYAFSLHCSPFFPFPCRVESSRAFCHLLSFCIKDPYPPVTILLPSLPNWCGHLVINKHISSSHISAPTFADRCDPITVKASSIRPQPDVIPYLTDCSPTDLYTDCCDYVVQTLSPYLLSLQVKCKTTSLMSDHQNHELMYQIRWRSWNFRLLAFTIQTPKCFCMSMTVLLWFSISLSFISCYFILVYNPSWAVWRALYCSTNEFAAFGTWDHNLFCVIEKVVLSLLDMTSRTCSKKSLLVLR